MILVVVVVIVALSFGVYSAYFSSTRETTTSTCAVNFVCQPVGDVIIPKIARNYGGGVSNLPLNLTAGETMSLKVTLYLQIDANVSARFQVLTWAGGSSGSSAITATFAPETLSAKANANASSIMTVRVSSSAPFGEYSAVVSFQDASNPSYSWGTNVQIDVEGS